MDVDYLVPLREIGPLLASVCRERVEIPKGVAQLPSHSEKTNLTCPDCHGPIERMNFGHLTELRCRAGHSYSFTRKHAPAHDDAEERAL